MLDIDKAVNMTNNSEGYITGNSTTLFIFCLYENEHSAKNCASGLFSSLPLESRKALLASNFDAEFQNVTGNRAAAAQENYPISPVILVFICVLGMSIAGSVFMFRLLWHCFLKVEHGQVRNQKSENNDEDSFVVEMHTLKKKKKYKSDEEMESHRLLQLEPECTRSCNSGEISSTGYARNMYYEIHSNSDIETTSQEKGVNGLKKILPDEDSFVVEMHNLKKKNYKSDAKIESHRLLHLEAKRNLPCNSDETPCTGYVSDTYDEIHSNSDQETTSQEKDLNGLKKVLPVVNQKSAVHCDAKDVEEKPIDLDFINSVKARDAHNYDVVKTDMIVLRSPNKVPGQEDSAIATVEPLNVQASAASGTDLDLMRLNWTKIFLFLIRHIYPSKYSLFFNLLLDNAGCQKTGMVIESIEVNTKGKIEDIMFQLMHYWLKGVWPKAKPKDIEDVFEALEWNFELYEFREYMRDPPYLQKENNWSEPSYPCISSGNMIEENQRLCLHQSSIPQIQELDDTCEKQPQINDTDVSSQRIEEHNSFANHHISDVFESKEFISRRKAIRRSGDDISEIISKYRKVLTCSKEDKKNKNRSRHMPYRNNFKFQSQKRKKAIARNYVSSSSTATTSSAATSFAATSSLPSSTVSPGTFNRFSSGYGSMSSNNIVLGTEQTVSNNTCNGIISEDDFSENKDVKASNKRELLRNSLRCSYNSEKPHRRLSRIPCRSTINSWDVYSTECPLLTSSVIEEQVTRKQKRNIDKKYPLERKKQMVYKKRPKSYRQKSRLRTNRKLSGDKHLKSVHLACLIETFVDDLLTRITPNRDDILSLKFQSYSDANRFVTSWNENIYVIFSEKHCLPLREREWNTIQTYVKNVRNVVITKTQERYNQNRDFLFLNHNGDPLV